MRFVAKLSSCKAKISVVPHNGHCSQTVIPFTTLLFQQVSIARDSHPSESVGVGERDQHVRRQTDVVLLHLSVSERNVILQHKQSNVETATESKQ